MQKNIVLVLHQPIINISPYRDFIHENPTDFNEEVYSFRSSDGVVVTAYRYGLFKFDFSESNLAIVHTECVFCNECDEITTKRLAMINLFILAVRSEVLTIMRSAHSLYKIYSKDVCYKHDNGTSFASNHAAMNEYLMAEHINISFHRKIALTSSRWIPTDVLKSSAIIFDHLIQTDDANKKNHRSVAIWTACP